jgi:hypothetical protein
VAREALGVIVEENLCQPPTGRAFEASVGRRPIGTMLDAGHFLPVEQNHLSRGGVDGHNGGVGGGGRKEEGRARSGLVGEQRTSPATYGLVKLR